MICERCGKEFAKDWRIYKNNKCRFCSKSCANGRSKSEESKRKTSLSVKRSWERLSAEEKDKACQRLEKIRLERNQASINHEAHMQRPVKVYDTSKKEYIFLDINYRELESYEKEHLVCEICGGVDGVKKLAKDHDHETGHFRGLLCHKCNTALDWYIKNEALAKKYLNKGS